MKELILAYQGEMTLKGLNRGKFEARLAKTIRWRLEPLGKFKVYQAQSTVFIEPKEDGLDMDEAFRRVSHVFGIVKLSRAVECPKDFDAIFTGDLGEVGSALLHELMHKADCPVENHQDCGCLLYDVAAQNVQAGGSGAGCSAAVLAAHILPGLAKGQLRRVLLLSTGALMSQTTFLQGESIPGIAHLVELLAPDVPV